LRLSKQIVVRIVGALCALLLLVPGSWAKTRPSNSKSKSSTTSKKPSLKSTAHTSKVSAKSSKRGRKSVKKPRGQQAIDSDRTREIQAALIREHYMQGEASGSFDAGTKAALAKFQKDNGWQTKVLPDSRALIKLGLGPSHEGLLNPESAAISAPREIGMEKGIPGGATPHK
jgi:peptidoglycan hydrolase-like protein with peptidoglycan-binding domain